MRVAQGIFARTQWRNLEQWRVRWKVGAAVALPLAAAMLLGGLRLNVFFTDYSEYDSAADRISDIPAIMTLESVASTVAGGQVYGITTDQDLVELSTAITQATVRAGRNGIDPSVAKALWQMTDTAEAIRSGGKGGGDPVKAAALNNAIVDEAVGTVDKLLTPIGIGPVASEKTRLFDVLLGKVEGFHWLMAAMSAIQQPTQAEDFYTAQGAFMNTVDTIGRVMPSAEPVLDRVVRANNIVLKDMIDVAMRTQVVDLVELRRLVLESRDVFAGLIQQVIQGIITDVDDAVGAARSAAVKASVVVLGTLIAALALALLVARSLLRPLRRLRAGAAELAEKDLPNEVERITMGTQLDQIAVKPVPVHTGEEIGEIARTVDVLHAQALKLAAQQQLLRDQVNDMFETMARRNQTLVDRQLSMIEALEFEEKDPERLGHLFRLDHLAARMRRNSANLLVLAGTRLRHDRSGPVEVRDILRAALSEVEDYQRVKSGATPDGWVAGIAATDVVHLIAEMLENALRASPPDSDVTFSYSRTSEGGLLIEVIDEGIGIVPEELKEINERLATPATVTVATTRQMGMFVVGRLAERHGITVRLRRTNDRALNPGITASLHIPAALIEVPSQDPDDPANQRPVIPVQRNVLGTAKAAVPTNTAVSAAKTVVPAAKTALSPPAARRIGAPPASSRASTEPAADVVAGPPVITSYGLPKRVPGINRKARRKSGGAAITAQTPSASTSNASKPTTSTPNTPSSGTSTPTTATAATTTPTTTTSSTSTPTTTTSGTSTPTTTTSDTTTPTTATSATSTPTSTSGTPTSPGTTPASTNSGPPTGPHERVAKTTSFFKTSSRRTPSAWLAEPATGELPVSTDWSSPADEGWSAAQRVAEQAVTARTVSGLPKRDPGNQLVPGGAEQEPAEPESNSGNRPDPETIRAGLSSYDRGVRDGRATGNLKPFAAEDVR